MTQLTAQPAAPAARAQVEAFAEILSADPTYQAAWLGAIRQTAAQHFQRLGLPTISHEDWRLTNVAPLGKIRFTNPSTARTGATAEMVGSWSLTALGANELVFLNGVFSPELSTLRTSAARVSTLAEAIHDPLWRDTVFAHEALPQSNGFVALNTAAFADGAFIQIPADLIIESPIHLLFVTTSVDRPTLVQPRICVQVGARSQVTLVQTYAGSPDQPHLTNAVLELAAESESKVEIIKLQREADSAFHIAHDVIRLAAKATLQTLSLNTGGAVVRNNLQVRLDGPFAEATLNGITMITGHQHVDNHTLLDHARENCPSHELYKHLLGGKASGVFRGKILVRPDSQRTDSKQTSKTILLSDDAVMDSQPQLEIYADDVKCTHGSTTGPLDDEQLFYLRSRGVNAAQARALLTYAFAGDVLGRVWHPEMKTYLEELVAAELHRLHLDQAAA